ncbi:MAG: hypothetical protein ACOC14_01495 [Bacillota bacterium]
MKQLFNLYMEKTRRPLSSYIVYEKKGKIAKKAYLAIAIFIFAVVFYILEQLRVISSEEMRLEYLGYLAIPFLLFPLIYINQKTTGKVVVTTDAFAQQNMFRRFKLFMFKDVVKVKQTRKNHLKVKTHERKCVIRFPDYNTQLEALKTIFNYQGHFDEKKRPHKVFVENNRISVQELTPSMDPQSADLLERFEGDYYHSMAGHIDSILLYNVQVNRVRIVDKRHVMFELSHIDIKTNHPENIENVSMQTDDAMILFQDVTHIELYNVNKDKTKDVELLGTELADLKKIANKSEIQETSFKKQENAITVDMELTQGVKRQRARFTFTKAIHGFNALEKPSWFEKKA